MQAHVIDIDGDATLRVAAGTSRDRVIRVPRRAAPDAGSLRPPLRTGRRPSPHEGPSGCQRHPRRPGHRPAHRRVGERFLAAVAVGYQVAIRAGVALHARDPAYHASGAWGAVGAAAAAASLLALPADAVRDAIGLAEYHAPIAGIMRSVAEPAMTKDACGHGAWLGTTPPCWRGAVSRACRPSSWPPARTASERSGGSSRST